MEGWAYLLLGELDVAESRLRQVVEQGPKNRWAWEGLAEVARQRGNTHDEREAWQRIAEIAPDDPAVRKRLEALGSGK
jgi:predicted Zn-dependent protease